MNTKILYVDDDADILTHFQQGLREILPIDTALGGEEGLAGAWAGSHRMGRIWAWSRKIRSLPGRRGQDIPLPPEPIDSALVVERDDSDNSEAVPRHG